MQYHKIPQNVTTYEGRIVGKFTMRQFVYLAIGFILLFILTTSPLPSKYKLLFGGVVAFFTMIFTIVNYEGRNTDTWLLNYFRAIFAPTQRVWRKQAAPTVYLLPSYQTPQPTTAPIKKKSELEGFLKDWGRRQQTSDLTKEEAAFLDRLKKLQK